MIFGYRILNERRREERDIKSHLEVLLTHMLKCKYQNNYENKSSWRGSIRNAKNQIQYEFKENSNGTFKGSLYSNFYLKQLDIQKIYEKAVENAADETGFSFQDFPVECEWTKEQLIDDKFIHQFLNEWGQDNV